MQHLRARHADPVARREIVAHEVADEVQVRLHADRASAFDAAAEDDRERGAHRRFLQFGRHHHFAERQQRLQNVGLTGLVRHRVLEVVVAVREVARPVFDRLAVDHAFGVVVRRIQQASAAPASCTCRATR